MDDAFLDRLAANLEPVKPRSSARDLTIIGGFLLLQLAAMFLMGVERIDLRAAMLLPDFWYRLVGCGLIGLAASLATVRALGPADRPRMGLPLAAIALTAVGGVALLLFAPGSAGLMHQDNMMEAMGCTKNVLLFALPLAALFAWMLRNGAPARPRSAAFVAALAAAGWGGALFAMHCPHDTREHTVVWIPLAFFLTTLIFSFALRRFARW